MHVPVLYIENRTSINAVGQIPALSAYCELYSFICTVSLADSVSGTGKIVCVCQCPDKSALVNWCQCVCVCVLRPGPQSGVDSRALSNVCSHEESACLAAASAC